MASQVFTLEEVAKHSSKDDCWLVIGGKVYNVTKFIADHPGGDDVLLSSVGKDATDDFKDVEHSTTAQALMDGYYIGIIDVTTIAIKVKYTPPSLGMKERGRYVENKMSSKVFTMEEVAKHNSMDDCWLLIDGKVYDVTKFMDDHPGGDDVLLSSTAKDATDDFKEVGHSMAAQDIMDECYIGTIDATTLPTEKYIPYSRMARKERMRELEKRMASQATKFLDDHSGGDDVLLSSTAKDATDYFEDVGHSMTAGAMMGEINATTIPTKSYNDGASTLLWESTSTSSSEIIDQESESETLEGILIDTNAKPSRLSYPFIKSITRNFSEEIGRGGFGVVYMGHLKTGRIAVKKLSILQGFFDTLFMEEINCLIKTKHDNVVRFLGYCWDSHGELVRFNQGYLMAEVPQRLLCFEYVPNGNLQMYLKDNSHKNEWNIRYQMIRGICHGLNYLHEQRIVHLDLKPENILLDAHLEPKITDFGVSKCFDEGISRVQTKNIRGTLGSTAPETIDSGEITFKSDIYGLGIIIIKLLAGSNNYDFENWHTSLEVDGPQVKSCIEIAQRCVSFDQHKRPRIGEIMQKLNEIERS